MVKIGIVGAGIIGREHADAVKENPDCCLVGVCDTVKERAVEIANGHNAEIFTDYKEMCRNVEMDAVILNLPHFLHHDAAVFFLENKISVLVEKPMAMTVSECDSMIETAKKNNTILAVGHVQRYYSACRDVKELLENKKYGKLCMITEHRNVNYLLNRPKWFLDKKLSGGGIVMNYGAHTLDKIMYVTGEKVTEVKAIMGNPLSDDNIEINAQILMKLSNGISATVTYCGCPGVNSYETVFYFEHGVAKMNGTDLSLSLSEDGKFFKKEGTANLIPEQLTEFIKLLKGEKNNMVTPEYGREIIRVLEDIFKN